MAITNQAAWLDGKGEKLRVAAADTGKPGKGEVLIENLAVAINPVDHLVQDYGVFVQKWPTILGCDLAGEVVEVGEGVSSITKGQRVLAHPLSLLTGKPENAGFQKYAVIVEAAVCPIPDNMTYEAAAVIPLALSTSIAGLYQHHGLPLPQENPQKSGKKVLIWGGSSSVGSAAIQLAVASGLEVVTTASKRNFDHCKKLGAEHVFDYSSPTIVDDLLAVLPKDKFAGAYDAVGAGGSTMKIAEILDSYGGGSIVSAQSIPEGLPKSVTGKQVFAATVPQTDAGKAVYKDWLPTALATGQYKPAPNPQVIGEGLDKIQTGIDTLRKGVSATKIVVKL